MIICTYEDRANELVGLRLLICSLARHLPDVDVVVTCPIADERLRTWLADYPRVALDESPALLGMGWDVKSTLLLQLLDIGHETVVWMDSDIIVTSDFRRSWHDTDSLVVTEERPLRRRHVVPRTTGWGLRVGRTIPGINSCLIRARPAHRPLLLAWKGLLASAEYQAARARPWYERQPHVLGDQDVLTGLLGSAEFAHVDIQVLRRGSEIIQHFHVLGYPPLERLANLVRGMPPLVHSQGPKPWHHGDVPSFIKAPTAYFQYLYLETSPYSYFARQYREKIEAFPRCFEVSTLPGRMSRTLGCGHPSTIGLVQVLLVASWSWVFRLGRLLQRVAARVQRARHLRE